MEFWSDIITGKSWDVLKELKNKFRFILIGGWAAYLWTKTMKSRDIDCIVDLEELEKIKLSYTLKKNDHLKKYEIIVDEIDIDIYVPYYSRLTLPIEEIKKHTTKIENFDIVKPEILLILKQGAELDRAESEKGLKDRIDIMNLLVHTEIDFQQYFDLLKKHKITNFADQLKRIIQNFREIKYLNLNPRQFKLVKKDLIKSLRNIK